MIGIQFLFVLACTSSGKSNEINSYSTAIQPLLSKYCIECHGADEQNGQTDFSKLTTDRMALRQRKLWRKGITQLDAGLMPPTDAIQPSSAELKQLLDWMISAVNTIDTSDPANNDPGPLLIRRFTLAEYNNTIRDLLGFEYDASIVGMTKESGEGNRYGNLSTALNVSPAQMDKYFAAAESVLDRFFATELSSSIDGRIRDQATASRESMFGLNPGQWRDVKAKVTPPEGATERDAAKRILSALSRRAYRRPINDSDIKSLMQLYDTANKHGKGYVDSIRQAMKAILVSPHFLFRIEESQAESGKINEAVPVADVDIAVRLSYFLWSSMPDELLLDLAERGKLTKPGQSDEPVPFSGTVIGAPGSEMFRGNNRDRVFDGNLSTFLDGPDDNSHWIGLDLGEPREIRRLRFAARPAHEYRMEHGKFQASSTPDFSNNVIDLLEISERPDRGYIVYDLKSPQTYQYIRYIPPPNSYGNIAELEVWGYADGTVLQQQVRRMLADSRARALTENFATRWLQIDRLTTARPSTEFFPEFNGDLRLAMHDETTMFFDQLIRDDRSLLDLLDADYTFANEKLASFYGIDGIKGKELQRVSLKPEHHRGGLLRMGSVLALTSHTSRTSPTLRGKWVLETLFGTSPPPPPANVSQLNEDEVKKEATTFREKMAQHASDKSCSACHRQMDPLGFALDNYNAVGKWRDTEGNQPLDVAGKLPTGESFSGATELKSLILTKKTQFIRNLTEQLLMYALGRELDFYDDLPVQKITQSLESNDYRISALILGIVESYPFQNRRSRALPDSQ